MSLSQRIKDVWKIFVLDEIRLHQNSFVRIEITCYPEIQVLVYFSL